MSFGFAHPWVLLLLPALALIAWLARRWQRRAVVYSRAGGLRAVGARRDWLGRMPDWLRGTAVVALIITLAGPRTGVSVVDVDADGIAITVVLDVSTSMLAEDFSPRNRFQVAKETTAEFIRGRRYDRIGLVAFAGEALTQVPLTIDYPVLFHSLERLDIGTLEDGTAIGTAIATAANRLRDAEGESRVMVLMTDGQNNRGDIDPITAAQAAAAFGIRVYTIGVGSHGVAPYPIGRGVFGQQYANVPVQIDEELLERVADETGGRYFRATSERMLDSIYGQIDELETTAVQVRRYTEYTPHYLPFLLLGAMLLLGEWTLRASRWGRVP